MATTKKLGLNGLSTVWQKVFELVKSITGNVNVKTDGTLQAQITKLKQTSGTVVWKSFFSGSWNYLSTQLTLEKSELRKAKNIRLTFGTDTSYRYVYETAVASWFGTGTTNGYRIVVPFVANSDSSLDEIVSFLNFYIDDSATDEVVLTFVKGLSVGKDVQVAEITATSCVDNGIPPITQIEYCE